MSAAEPHDEPHVQVFPPEEALRRARPLPPRDLLVNEELADAEWTALHEALAET